MSDLISRQAAIDAILHNQEVYSNNFGDDPIDKYTTAIISNDVQTIVQLPSALQWIPCSERLPEEDVPVLVTTIGKWGGFVSMDWVDPYTHKWNRSTKVIAWIPLPEPYKGVTE